MPTRNSKVVSLHQQKAEIQQAGDRVSEAFPGFSLRLNQLIDMTDIDIPPLDEGRQAYIANLLESSKMAPGDWLKKDRPPKTLTLRKLLIYLIEHLPDSHNPYKIEAWLKYGEAAVASPFGSSRSDNQALIPLATSLIVEAAKSIGIAGNAFDLDATLKATVEILADFQLTHEDMVEGVHRKIIAQYIRANLKQAR